jgi:hypothetical protein
MRLMKMAFKLRRQAVGKRLASAVMALTLCLAGGVSVFAEGEATFNFNNDSAMSLWSFFGPTDAIGAVAEITRDESEAGIGSLLISASVPEPVSGISGMSVKAEDLGLENFAGCVVEASVMFAKGAEAYAGDFYVFTDGELFIRSGVQGAVGRWTTATVTVPENAYNASAGFGFPAFDKYEGRVMYVGHFTVTDKDGNMVANMGDRQDTADGERFEMSVLSIILFFLLLLVVIAGIVFGIYWAVKTYKKNKVGY